LQREDVETFAVDWGRWLLDQEGCWPAGAGCVSLESGYRSPQRWHDEKPIFGYPPNNHRAEAFELLITEGAPHHGGLLTWRQARVMRTHYVDMPYWRLIEWGIPSTQWLKRRVRHAHAHGIADYMELLDGGHDIMARALERFAHLL
jgi:hypothetical protein